EEAGLRFSGMSPDGMLPEIVEIPDHPWYVGVQFHPELKSKPFDPHPLFTSFIRSALDQSRLVSASMEAGFTVYSSFARKRESRGSRPQPSALGPRVRGGDDKGGRGGISR